MQKSRISKLAGLALIVSSANISGCIFPPPMNEAGTINYSDNFETNKALSDSYAHSQFAQSNADVHLDGLLRYVGNLGERQLLFEKGFLVDSNAFIDYKFLNPNTQIIGGSINFSLSGRGHLEVFGSQDGNSWTSLDSYNAVDDGETIHLLLENSAPANFIRFEGDFVNLDNLNVSIDYK